MFYVSDQRSARIVRIDAIEQSTDWSDVSPDPAVVTLTRPCGVRFAAGRLFVADIAPNVVVVELASGATPLRRSSQSPGCRSVRGARRFLLAAPAS
jgi:hypothetical protein